MNFDQNLKAFLKALPLNSMSGHQKFVAVAAAQARGDLATEVSAQDVQRQWKKSMLGVKYNPAYYDRAQGAGWVDPTGAKGMFRVCQAGLENLEALAPEFISGDLKKSGSLTMFRRKATHTFDKFLRTTLAATKNQVLTS